MERKILKCRVSLRFEDFAAMAFNFAAKKVQCGQKYPARDSSTCISRFQSLERRSDCYACTDSSSVVI